MNPCIECGGKKELRVKPGTDKLTLWETHVRGCSWSPMVEPSEGSWAMRDVDRTDTVEVCAKGKKHFGDCEKVLIEHVTADDFLGIPRSTSPEKP